jgi:ribosome-binding ATPase YchF (GTP1/OBG family)
VNETLLLGKPARLAGLNAEELELIKSLMLLTLKPVIYAANVADSDLAKGKRAASLHLISCVCLVRA